MGKKPGTTKNEEAMKSTPRGTYSKVPQYLTTKDKSDREPTVYKTFKCQNCGKPISKNSHRLYCYDCDHDIDPEPADLTGVLTKNQVRKAAKRQRRETRKALVVAASGIAQAEVVQEFLEGEGYA